MRLKEYPIGDHVRKCQTWNPKSSDAGSFDYIDLSSVDKDTKSIASIERYDCSDAPSRARQLVETDDVLVATVRPNLNGVALVNGAHHGMTASTGYCVLRPDKDKLDSKFLFHWVKTGVFVQRMVDVATGANYPAVSDAKVKASKIPLPPLAEQKRIAAILDAADALRAKRRESLIQLDTLLQSTFLDMFGDPVTNPKGWEQVQFTDVCDIQGGTQPPKSEWISEPREGYVRMLQIRDFTQPDRGKVEYVKDRHNLKKCDEDDILIGRYGASVGKILEGLCGAYNVAIAKCLWDRDRVGRAYVLAWLRSDHFQNSVTSFGGRAAQAGFNKTDLGGLRLSLPPINLQHRFAAIVESVERQKASQVAHLAELDTLFASLHSRAFGGDL